MDLFTLMRAGYKLVNGKWVLPEEKKQELQALTNTDEWEKDKTYDRSLINPSFNWQQYLSANPDLKGAGIDTQAEAERHYALYGKGENRPGAAPPSPDWEWKEPDLQPVWVETGEGGYTSWQSSGGSSWQKKQGAPDTRLTINSESVSGISPIVTAQGGITIGTKMNYNGVPVVFVPQEWANQGLFKQGTQYYSTAFLNKDLWQYAKPAILDQSVLDSNSNVKSSLGDYQYKNYGYIIDQEKYDQYKANTVNLTKEWGMNAYDDWKRSVPIQGITERNGQLMYYGMRGNSSAGELTTFDASGQGMLNPWKYGSSGVIPRLGGYIGDFISEIRPIAQVASIFSPPVAMFLAAYDATTAATQGKWGQAMMAALPMFVPSASGQPPIIDIPAVAEATKSLSSALNISTQAAGNMIRGAVELAANGGDLKQLLTKEVATYLGQQAGGFVEKLFTDNKLDKLGEVAKSVSAAGTRALLLNQDVGEATKSAFIKTAVPMAMETVPGWADFAKNNPNAANDLKSAAVTAAQTGDFKAVVQDYSGRVITRAATDAAERELNAEGKSLTDSQKRLISSTVTSAIQGKPIDAALQRYAIDEAKRTVNDGIAVSQGWESDAQKTSAQKMYGNTIKPQEYIAKQQGWEDLAEKNAALKAYGDAITPAGFKEREQVKGIDPTFDAEAYAKLNEITGDPYRHFLEQGKQANLPTNYEKGAEAALRSIGYKPDGDDIKNVADLFKQSANPDVALNQYYDQHWVTPEEAAAVAKDVGFDLTPEQLSRYTGQTKTGQQAVLEDVSTAARIGKTAQDTRNAFIDKQLEPVIQAYKKEGYSDAEIQAALPGLRDQLNAAVGNKVTAMSDYASQVKAVYGDKSPEYAAAQRKLLDTQSAVGGYGLVKESDAYKSATGTYVPMNDPAMERVWARKEPTFDEIEAALRQGIKTGEAPEVVVTAKKYPAEVQSAIKDYMLGNKTSLDKYPDIKSDIDSYMKEAPASDILKITGGSGSPSAAAQRLKQEYAVIGIPGDKSPVYSDTGPQKTAIIGEIPSGTGDGKVPTLFGMPLSVSSMQFDSNSWVRLDNDTWVTPDNTYTFIAFPGQGGEVIENRTNNVVVTLPKEKIEPILPKPETPRTPITPIPPTEKPPEPKQTQVEDLIKEAERQAAEQRFSEEEVAAMLKGMGYTPTPEEVASLAGIKTPEQAQKEANEYVDPRLVTPDEVRRMYHDLGLVDPTEEDVQRFSGQRAQPEVLGLIKPYLPTASANVITRKAEEDKIAMGQQQQQIGDINERINQLQRQGMSQAEATNQAIRELSAGQTQIGQQIGQQQQQTQQQFGDINERINQLQQQGLSQTEATNQALRELASGQSQLGQQIGQQQQQTQQQFGDVNTRIAQLQQQGLSLSEATNRALQELTAGQAGLGQRIGELATGQAGLGQRIGDVQTGLQNQLGGLTSGLTQALTGLGTQIGKTNQGLQQQIGQAQQQANFANLLTLLGVAKQQEKEPPPIPITGEIKPYDFSTDLLQGLYPQKRQTPFSTNDQLLNLTRGIR